MAVRPTPYRISLYRNTSKDGYERGERRERMRERESERERERERERYLSSNKSKVMPKRRIELGKKSLGGGNVFAS